MTATVPTTIPQVVVSDIGPTKGLLREIDKTIRYFNDGDLATGTAVEADRGEVLLGIGYRAEGVILSHELSIKHGAGSDEEARVGDEIEALIL